MSPASTWHWLPVSCAQLVALLEDAPFPWWICGGHAIDLFLGRATRPHGDIDIGILRGDQPALFARLPAYEIHLAQSGRLRELSPAERRSGTMGPDHHGLWCRPRGREAFSFEVLLNDGDRDEWVYRRSPALRRPLAEVVAHTPDGTPYLAPEIQLLFKAKEPRAKDAADFAAAAPALDAPRRTWLREALARCHPDHPWIAALDA